MYAMFPAKALLLVGLSVGACSSTSNPADSAAADRQRLDQRRPDQLPAGDRQAADRRGDSRRQDLELVGDVTCASPAPAGAAVAAPLPTYSKGTCPKLVPGMNSLDTAGGTRQFILVVPAAPVPGESYPLLAMWYWLKGSAGDFLSKGQVQVAADQQRFVAIIPEAKGDLSLFGVVDLPWPITTVTAQARVDEELAFFDDMLACVAAQQPVNKECVSAIGVSAGALYAVKLAEARSQHLASFVSLSGGVGSAAGATNNFIWPWVAPQHKLPALVLWGGPNDSCALLNFQMASLDLEKGLTAGGHFFVECVHNCGHGEPPLVPPSGKSKYATIWEFAFRHPYWLKPGQSPYVQLGPPPDIPWCGIGSGSATPRTGPCDAPGCPI